MTTFRCKQSGNTVSFTAPEDIESMRKEAHYEEVKDERPDAQANAEENAAEENAHKAVQVKKRGRPSKK